MADFGGFPQILSLFYATFHYTEGSKVLYQVPPGSATKSTDPLAFHSPLIDFESINSYIIPKPQLCNKPLTLRANNYRIVSHPVHIWNSDYARNSFLFSFCFVFDKNADISAYLPVVRKLSKMFQALEEQNKYLSAKIVNDGLKSIVDQVFEDLNNYCECFIPIDDSNSINIKLFPLHPPPPHIKSFHVPLSTVQLRSVMEVNWDPTMEKIVEYIDGINSVSKIADLADTDFNLTRKCIQHLMYYGCVIVVDIFQFSNVYACTPDVSLFVEDGQIGEECLSYVVSPHAPKRNFCELLELYCLLNAGTTVKEWYISNRKLLRGIDVRRFISFGVIKGFIYRVHAYPVFESLFKDLNDNRDLRLLKLMRKTRHFDEICTDLKLTKEQVLGTLEKHGDLLLVRA
ncbi:nitrogen permease regulator 2 [Lipomyces japonicus]|uniref:nitrogen permease regulator 2 n=1 Tax=Lipomyces japonicus TaxID=56871 RepID=UPI0034CED3D2